jgi:hypothetical protein
VVDGEKLLKSKRFVNFVKLESTAKRQRAKSNCSLQDAGCRMQDAGCRMQDAGCRMQDAGCRMQDV